MPWFRATRRVDGPSGQVWEIYVTRGVAPAWRPGDYDPATDGASATVGGTWLLALAYEVPMFVLTQILWPLVRVVVTLPWVVLRALRTPTRTVEAIAFAPHAGYAWTTAPEHVARVVDEVAAGLARGTVPRPEHSTFLGERTDANL